jgi:type III secretion system (T3SS) SseB-like protein
VRSADSAGRPFAGRAFEGPASPFAGDDGSAPPAFLAAHAAFTAGRVGPEAVVAALRDVRLLIPLLADLGEAAEHDGRVVEKKAELALVTVAGPDGRRVLPAFSSAAAMAVWNPSARPVPAPARQVALGAAADGTELVIVDPGSPTCFGLRRSALEALARGLPWSPPWHDPVVLAALAAPARAEPAVADVTIGTDDPGAVLEGAEVGVALVVHPVLDRDGLAALLDRVRSAWTDNEVVAARVDSLAVRIDAAR